MSHCYSLYTVFRCNNKIKLESSLFLIFEYLDCCVKIKKMSDWDTTTYLTKSHAKKGSSNEKTQVRQAQRAGTLETRQKMFAGTNNKGNTAHHAKLDRETEELKHKVSLKSPDFGIE